jgi:uncharacterized membrane protein YwaF
LLSVRLRPQIFAAVFVLEIGRNISAIATPKMQAVTEGAT